MAAKQMVAEIHAEVPDKTLAIPESGNSVTALIQMAIAKIDGDNGQSVVQALTGLYDLYERDQRRKAEAAFNKALADFQVECPPIQKARTARINTKSGASFSYKYAELDEISETIKPYMKRLGLAYTWDTEITGDQIKAICTLRHIDGHSVSASFQCPTDSKAEMSGAQRHGAAVTYAKRQSLIAVLGLTTTETDTDAQRGISREQQYVSTEQANEIDRLLRETNSNRPAFFKYYDVQDIPEMTVAQYHEAVRQLSRKPKVASAGY